MVHDDSFCLIVAAEMLRRETTFAPTRIRLRPTFPAIVDVGSWERRHGARWKSVFELFAVMAAILVHYFVRHGINKHWRQKSVGTGTRQVCSASGAILCKKDSPAPGKKRHGRNVRRDPPMAWEGLLISCLATRGFGTTFGLSRHSMQADHLFSYKRWVEALARGQILGCGV